MIRTIKRIGICLILLAFLAFGGWVFWMNKDNEVAVEPQQQVELSDLAGMDGRVDENRSAWRAREMLG